MSDRIWGSPIGVRILSLQIKNQEGNERILQNVFGTTKRPS